MDYAVYTECVFALKIHMMGCTWDGNCGFQPEFGHNG
jgi:hypothetical protein